jgi:DNA-binding XRE family transcriptional regulator
MPAPEAIRAARAYLDITRGDLAKAIDLSITGIANIENKESNARPEVIARIQKYFWEQGIEFVDGAFRLHRDFITILEGDQGIIDFFMDVMKTAELVGGEFLVSGMDEVKFYNIHQRLNISNIYRGKMDNMEDRVTYRVLVHENQRETLKPPYAVPYATYKTLPEDRISSDVPFYIYGDKLAIILDGITKIIIIKDQSLVDAYTRMFNTMWESKLANLVYTKI